MIAYFILGLCLLIGLILLSRWFGTADPKVIANAARIALLFVGGGILIAIVAGGRFALISMIVGAVLPALLRWRAILRAIRNAQGPSAGQQSEVGSRYLRMTLEHDTGIMSGVVLEGAYRGRELSELSAEELIDLLRQCRADDPQSARLLEAWLDRTQPDLDWRAAMAGHGGYRQQEGATGGESRMTRAEALRILGLEEGADAEAIKRAHRQLMQKLHPDRGGSSYLAARINEAKDFLLGS